MTPAAAARRRALGLVAVALALLVALAFLLRPKETPADAAPPAAATSAPATTAPTTSAAATTTAAAPLAEPTSSAPTGSGSGDLAAPTVVATPVAGRVQFAWSSAGSKPGDTYRVHVGATPADAEIADPVTVAKAAYTVTSASGSAVCLIAMIVRSGETSPASPAVCATAR